MSNRPNLCGGVFFDARPPGIVLAKWNALEGPIRRPEREGVNGSR
jgi:hypothetical protein